MKNADFNIEAELLLREWYKERAYRLTSHISQWALLLSTPAMLVDVFFGMPAIVLIGDIMLLLGSGLSYALSRSTRGSHRIPAWPWIYIGIWAGCITGLAGTGGINSPLIGSYGALLLLGGMLIQQHLSSWIVVTFVFLNLLFWEVAESFFPNNFGQPPEHSFSFFLNSFVLGGMLLLISQFIRSERDLGRELLQRYAEVAKTKKTLNDQEEVYAAKNVFLANVSHELRTPLAIILGFSDLLRVSDKLSSESRSFAETIYRNGQALSRFVDDLLDLSRTEASNMEVRTSEFDIVRILDEIQEFFKLQAQEKGVKLKFIYENSIPTKIVSDPTRIKQILRNVIGNGIKFTQHGEVRVIVAVAAWSQNRPYLRIEVKDTGCGLSESEQKRIFQLFSQVDSSSTRKFGGVGMGLHLSRNLARILGGDLQLITSRKDEGSRFVLWLPMDTRTHQGFSQGK